MAAAADKDERAAFEEDLPALIHEFWVGSVLAPRIPELRNTDGEPMMRCTSAVAPMYPTSWRLGVTRRDNNASRATATWRAPHVHAALREVTMVSPHDRPPLGSYRMQLRHVGSGMFGAIAGL